MHAHFAPIFGEIGMFGIPKWIVAGWIGALIGALVWAAAAILLEAEIGLIAVGIGWLVGRLIRGGGEKDADAAPEVTAAFIAVAAVGMGKVATVQLANIINVYANRIPVESRSDFMKMPTAQIEFLTFADVISYFDILWIFLAAYAAYRTSGGAGDSRQNAA